MTIPRIAMLLAVLLVILLAYLRVIPHRVAFLITALFALGWAVPYAIYRFSGDALSESFDPLRSLGSYMWLMVILSIAFAVLRAPKKKD